MDPTPEDLARIRAVEAKLTELDPIMESFCEQEAIRLLKTPKDILFPRRAMICPREDISRYMYLSPDLNFRELLARGFYPEMPWSLGAIASDSGQRMRMLTVSIFRGVPYSRLNEVLRTGLEDGLSRLRKITREDVVAKGDIVGSRPPSEEDYARLDADAAKFAELDSAMQRFCAREGLTLLPHGKGILWRGIRLPEDGRRYILLDTNTSASELMKRGFDPEMSCSLKIQASLPEEPGHPTRYYRRKILVLPYFQIVGALETGLKEALVKLRALTHEDIVVNGEEM